MPLFNAVPGSVTPKSTVNTVNYQYGNGTSIASYYGVCYGNSKFVAMVYGSNKAIYSIDGINWTETTLPISGNWKSACYGNGKFVAIDGNSDKAVYSEDGVNWIETTTNSSLAGWLNCICFGNDKFIATANSSRSIYSYDGITWYETTMPFSSNWASVTYGNNKFVAVTSYSNKAVYSTDGINWNETIMLSTSPNNAYNIRVCYGDNKFVTVVDNSNKAAYSYDGINWNEVKLSFLLNVGCFGYGDSRFIVGTRNGNSIYSPDGISWKDITLPYQNYLSVCYAKNKFVFSAVYKMLSCQFATATPKALTTETINNETKHTYNGDTLYLAPHTEVNNYNEILTSIMGE